MQQVVGGTLRHGAERLFAGLSRPDLPWLLGELLTIADCIAVVLAGTGCAYVYALLASSRPNNEVFLMLARISLVGAIVAAPILRDERLGSIRDLSMLVQRGLRGELLQRLRVRFTALVSVLLVLGFLARVIDQVPRVWAVSWCVLTVALVVTWRILLAQRITELYAKGTLRERVAVLGTGPTSEYLISHLSGPSSIGIGLVGAFKDDSVVAGFAKSSEIASLLELGKRHELDRVVLTGPSLTEEWLHAIVHRLKALNVEIAVCPDVVRTRRRSLQNR